MVAESGLAWQLAVLAFRTCNGSDEKQVELVGTHPFVSNDSLGIKNLLDKKPSSEKKHARFFLTLKSMIFIFKMCGCKRLRHSITWQKY